jgi:hypothetical protein
VRTTFPDVHQSSNSVQQIQIMNKVNSIPITN